jgi:hypothetical protein
MVGAVIVVIATTLTSLSVKAETVCEVTDPTGTPLNVRISPNGQIIGTVEKTIQKLIFMKLSVMRKTDLGLK